MADPTPAPDPDATPPAGPGRADCAHPRRDDRAVCTACGHCLHDVVLNGACLYCGADDLDPVAMSPKPVTLIPPDRLRRRPIR
jgi:hypothetical protein